MISDQAISILINLVWLLEFIAAIVGTLYIKKYYHSRLKHFILYLWLIVLTEFLGIWLFNHEMRNAVVYNTSKIIQYNYILYLFYTYLVRSSFKVIAKILIVVFNVALIANILMSEGFAIVQPSYAFTFGGLVISLVILAFLYEAVNTELVLEMRKYLIIWVATGLLLFHVVTLPLNSLANLIPEISPGSDYLLLIKVFVNILMYSTFTVGFIWSKEKYNS